MTLFRDLVANLPTAPGCSILPLMSKFNEGQVLRVRICAAPPARSKTLHGLPFAVGW